MDSTANTTIIINIPSDLKNVTFYDIMRFLVQCIIDLIGFFMNHYLIIFAFCFAVLVCAHLLDEYYNR